MLKKYKILLILFVLVLFVLGSGITYSIFTSGALVTTGNQEIAKFIFNTELVDSIEVPLTSINPGEEKTYEFSVSNSKLVSNEVVTSNVTLEYQIVLSTYHFMPLNINLYKLVDEEEVLVLTCDESYSRNSSNQLICNEEIQMMPYTSEARDNYILKIEFPSEYNEESYSNLVDYIDLEINSWQKVGD